MNTGLTTGRDSDAVDGIEEVVGDDALRAAESAERAALAGGADPLAGLVDLVHIGGPAEAFRPAALDAAASQRRENPAEHVALRTALKSAKSFSLMRWEKALDARDRAAREVSKASKRSRSEHIDESVTGLPVVVLGYDLARVADDAIAALGRCEGLYQRTSALVRITRAPGVPPLEENAPDAARRAHERALRRAADEGSPVIEPVPVVMVPELLSRVAEVRAPDRRTRTGDRRVAPPVELAARIVARRSYDPRVIPPLVSVSCSPLMLRGGELLTAPGYDRGSGLYLDWHGPPVEVPERPTRDDARAAAERLAGIFYDFIFQGDLPARRLSVAACIAAILTPLARHAVDGAVPAFMLGADAPNAGKTLAAQACGALILGRSPAVRPWCDDADEMQKTLGAIALHAPPIALFDNIRAHIEGGALEALLTSDTYAARILGASATPELPWRTTLYTTANAASYNADTARRFIHILMRGRGAVTAGKRPGEVVREFRFPRLVAHVLERRPTYLRDALTILRAHLLADRPADESLDSFEAWSSVVSSAVWWAFDADPALARPPEESNRDHTTARDLVAQWCVALRGQQLTFSALRERILAGEPRLVALRDALADLAGVADFARASTGSVTTRLARVVDRVSAAPWGGTMRLEGRKNRVGTVEYTATSTVAPPRGDGPGGKAGGDAVGGDDFDHPARDDGRYGETPPAPAPAPLPAREAWPASWRECVDEREAMAAECGAADPASVALEELRVMVARGEAPGDG